MKNNTIIFAAAWLSLFLFVPVQPQSGGVFTLTQTVIAGGGNMSAGGDFLLESTVGQAVAGNALAGSGFAVTSGFWNFSPLGPTAAFAVVEGRVTSQSNRPIYNARVTVVDSMGFTRAASTNIFGYFRFANVPVGETYVVSVSAKRFLFEPQLIFVNDNISDLNFVAVGK